MAIRYYDDAIIAKLKRWLPEEHNVHILKPDEVRRFFEISAADSGDKPISLPVIALSRNPDIELLATTKQPNSFDGKKLYSSSDGTLQLNMIPIDVNYQLDIYTKTMEEGDEYMRSFLFKLINNPLIRILIPYNDCEITHTANIRVLSTVSDTSAISERLFPGQFTRWTIKLEILDAFLFNIPYRKNWKFITEDSELAIVTPIRGTTPGSIEIESV